MIASEELKTLRDLTDALTSDSSYLIDQTKEWEYAFDAMPDCIFVINLEYKMRFINKVMCERLNKTRDELLDLECYNVLKCADRKCELNYSTESGNECIEKSFDVGEFYIDELNGWYKFIRSPITDPHKILLGYICVLRDITDRRNAVVGLEKREAMLQSIFRTMPAGTGVISSPDRKILLVNDTLCTMVGYTKEELEGQSARLLYETDTEFMRVGIEKYAQVEKYGLGDVETKFKKKDGSLIDIRLRTTPIGNDEIFGCAAFNFTASDITNFKTAAAKIARDRDRLDTLLKLSQIEDEDEIVSQALEEAVKFTCSDIGYFHFIEKDEIHLTLFKWSKKVLDSGMCTAKKTEHYPLTEAGIWADCIRIRKPVIHNSYEAYPYKKGLPEGHVVLTRHMSVPIFLDEKVVGIMGVGNKKTPYNDYDVTQVSLFAQHMIDIVKRVRAEKEKAISEAKYRQLFEVTPTGIYEIDFRLMKITYVNESMVEYTGYSKEELLSMNTLNLLGPRSQLKFIERIEKVKRGEIISPTEEFRVVRKDGSRFWVKTSATYRFDALGLSGATVVAVDITKEKQQIDALKSARDEARAANELLTTIYEFLPAVAVLTTTDDYIIKDVNKKFTEITGWTKENAIGKTTADLNLWVDERQRMDIRRMLEQHNYTVDNIISEFRDRNGKHLKGLTSVRKFTCGDEDCILAITRDITDVIDEICTQ
jgi:PAS domain S-box-containing protein